jgi:hypothetical protein
MYAAFQVPYEAVAGKVKGERFQRCISKAARSISRIKEITKEGSFSYFRRHRS